MQSKLGPHSASWKEAANRAAVWLRAQPGNGPKYLIEQNRNLGDTLHLIPIIRHYRLLHPNAKIAFLVGRPYCGAHEFNPDVDKIFTCPKMESKPRIALRKYLLTLKDIRIVSPSSHPYGAVWKELSWSYPNIADQYFHNAGIPDLKPKGGRRLRVHITDDEKKWADRFIEKRGLAGSTLCSLEWISYSHTPAWRRSEFVQFVRRMSKYKVKCISFAGPKDRPIEGSVSACGTGWRRTVALMERIHVHVGIGSGMTMLAAAAENQPKICEILVPKSVTMEGCGYADSVRIVSKDPVNVADHIYHKVLR